MFPTHMTRDVSNHRHQEHIDHAARINEIRAARQDGRLDVDYGAARRSTVARLSHAFSAARAALFPKPALRP